MERLFIAGGSGFLGQSWTLKAANNFEVYSGYMSTPIDVKGVKSVRCDLRSYSDALGQLKQIKPSVIVNMVALADVERCQKEPLLAYDLNVNVAKNLASVAKILGCKFVQISTDQIFDGSIIRADEKVSPCPINT